MKADFTQLSFHFIRGNIYALSPPVSLTPLGTYSLPFFHVFFPFYKKPEGRPEGRAFVLLYQVGGKFHFPSSLRMCKAPHKNS